LSRAQLYLVLGILFALIVAIFAVQNTERVVIYFLFWQIQNASKVIIILVSAAFGALAMFFLGFMWSYKKIRRIRQLEAEIADLKNPGDKEKTTPPPVAYP